MKTKLTISTVLIYMLIFSGCNKKFDHTPFTKTPNPTSCALCSYADSLEGSYRGFWQTHYLDSDSATITLEHIFMGFGNSLDSTQMFFKCTKTFDMYGSKIDTISLTNNSGVFYAGNNDTCLIDSQNYLRIHNWFANQFAFYPEILFDGIKQ